MPPLLGGLAGKLAAKKTGKLAQRMVALMRELECGVARGRFSFVRSGGGLGIGCAGEQSRIPGRLRRGLLGRRGAEEGARIAHAPMN